MNQLSKIYFTLVFSFALSACESSYEITNQTSRHQLNAEDASAPYSPNSPSEVGSSSGGSSSSSPVSSSDSRNWSENEVLLSDCPSPKLSDSSTWTCKLFDPVVDSGKILEKYKNDNYVVAIELVVFPDEEKTVQIEQAYLGKVTLKIMDFLTWQTFCNYSLILSKNPEVGNHFYLKFDVKTKSGFIEKSYYRKVSIVQ